MQKFDKLSDLAEKPLTLDNDKITGFRRVGLQENSPDRNTRSIKEIALSYGRMGRPTSPDEIPLPKFPRPRFPEDKIPDEKLPIPVPQPRVPSLPRLPENKAPEEKSPSPFPTPEPKPFPNPAPTPPRSPEPKTPGNTNPKLAPLTNQAGQIGQYNLLTNLDPTLVRTEMGSSLPSIGRGVEEVEKLFGSNAGGIIKSIGIVDSNQENAFFNTRTPDRITFHDELVKRDATDSEEKHQEKMRIVARHEAFHLFDSKYKLSSGAFQSQFDKLKSSYPNFFTELNEKEFLPGVDFGGHAKDNTLEFFASFMNSLESSTWETQLQAASPEFRKAYKESLQAVKANLSRSADLPASAPIRELVDRRLAFFSANSGPYRII